MKFLVVFSLIAPVSTKAFLFTVANVGQIKVFFFIPVFSASNILIVGKQREYLPPLV